MQNVMLQIMEYTYDAYTASISDRNLLSVRMTVNARRLLRRIYGEYPTSDSQFQSLLLHLHEMFRMGY